MCDLCFSCRSQTPAQVRQLLFAPACQRRLHVLGMKRIQAKHSIAHSAKAIFTACFIAGSHHKGRQGGSAGATKTQPLTVHFCCTMPSASSLPRGSPAAVMSLLSRSSNPTYWPTSSAKFPGSTPCLSSRKDPQHHVPTFCLPPLQVLFAEHPPIQAPFKGTGVARDSQRWAGQARSTTVGQRHCFCEGGQS